MCKVVQDKGLILIEDTFVGPQKNISHFSRKSLESGGKPKTKESLCVFQCNGYSGSKEIIESKIQEYNRTIEKAELLRKEIERMGRVIP